MSAMGTPVNFQRGDRVVHPKFGVGLIASIEKRQLSGEQPRLFYRVDFNKTSVWVPAPAPVTGRLRPITPKDELPRYRSLLNSPPALLDGDFRLRQSDLEKRMQLGTFESLCEVVRDLSARHLQKPLSSYERGLLRQTRAALVEEWAMVSGEPSEDVSGEIDGFLLRGRQGNHATT